MNNTLSLHSISVSDMDNNCYLICCGDEALLVDAADDAPAILQLAADKGVKITALLTSHRHWDHVRATKDIIKATGATHYASFLDSPALPAPVDVDLHQGDTVPFAGREFPAIILRGHTPGGAAIAVDIDGTTNLFVGDSLFPGGVGKTTSEETSSGCTRTSASASSTSIRIQRLSDQATANLQLLVRNGRNSTSGGNAAGRHQILPLSGASRGARLAPRAGIFPYTGLTHINLLNEWST